MNIELQRAIILNMAFAGYMALVAFFILWFFADGYVAVSLRTYQNLQGITNTTLVQYVINPAFGIKTMTPLFAVSALELVVWIFCFTCGIFRRPGRMFQVLAAYTIVMGLFIWFYSIA